MEIAYWFLRTPGLKWEELDIKYKSKTLIQNLLSKTTFILQKKMHLILR